MKLTYYVCFPYTLEIEIKIFPFLNVDMLIKDIMTGHITSQSRHLFFMLVI